jgi:hypothetical protein
MADKSCLPIYTQGRLSPWVSGLDIERCDIVFEPSFIIFRINFDESFATENKTRFIRTDQIKNIESMLDTILCFFRNRMMKPGIISPAPIATDATKSGLKISPAVLGNIKDQITPAIIRIVPVTTFATVGFVIFASLLDGN